MHDLIKYIMGVAAKSNVEKRQVGCLIVRGDTILAEGYNTDEVHAEAMACENLESEDIRQPMKAYVTHAPCPDCAKIMLMHNVTEVEVVEAYMKFDTDKLRYDLIPPSVMQGLAEVLTFGASKYKPNNWKRVNDPERYVAALMRHIEAYRQGEVFDKESKLHHLAHAATNIAFLLDMDHRPDSWKRVKLRTKRR